MLRVMSIASLIIGTTFLTSQPHQLCEGILEENEMSIPVSEGFSANGALMGISKEEFDLAIDRVEAFYAPVIDDLGGNLVVNRKWDDPTVNASASRFGRTYNVNMYGGLARHPAITSDGFTLVICHEIGHHLGGAPKSSRGFNTWASNEGQSDYFSGLKCLREVFTDEETARYVEENEIPETVKTSCQEMHETQELENVCMRIAMAGFSVSSLFQQGRNEDKVPSFDTPDTSVVSRTNDRHPATQCRLDTYFAGGLCPTDKSEPLDDRDPAVGTCASTPDVNLGERSRCWFKPPTRLGS